jgi:hypothetical protein
MNGHALRGLCCARTRAHWRLQVRFDELRPVTYRRPPNRTRQQRARTSHWRRSSSIRCSPTPGCCRACESSRLFPRESDPFGRAPNPRSPTRRPRCVGPCATVRRHASTCRMCRRTARYDKASKYSAGQRATCLPAIIARTSRARASGRYGFSRTITQPCERAALRRSCVLITRMPREGE